MDTTTLLFDRVVVATCPVILTFFSTRDANSLRLTSRLFHEVVTAHRWDDTAPELFSVKKWRYCFPRAIEYAALVGLRRVSVKCEHVSDRHFAYLRGIHALNMSKCRQSTVADKAFKNLRGVHTLNMSRCN